MSTDHSNPFRPFRGPFCVGRIAEELTNCFRFRCDTLTCILCVTTQWHVLHKLHDMYYYINLCHHSIQYCNLHFVLPMTVVTNLARFRDTMHRRCSSVSVPRRPSCLFLQSSAALHSQQIASLLKRSDHLFVWGDIHNTIWWCICPRLEYFISKWISVYRCSIKSMTALINSNNCLH